MYRAKSCLIIILMFLFCSASGQIITTIAGNGILGYDGDGGAATLAKMFDPERARTDGAGNIYIADNGNSRIRKVNSSGVISTFAGNGIVAHSGDGGLAVNAGISFPYSVATDQHGNVYIAEDVTFSGLGTGGAYVRKVNSAGVISTIAGNGTTGYSGDGGPAINAGFQHISDLVVDLNGNIYIADNLDNRIRKIDVTGTISTFAGTGIATFGGDGGHADSAGLNHPFGLAVDAGGNVYICDVQNSCVRKVNTSGIISTIAGTGTAGYSGDGGQATSAKMNEPVGVATDASGNLYIADAFLKNIRKVSTTGIISTLAGNGSIGYSGDGGPAKECEFAAPYGVFADAAGNVYIADVGNNVIRYISAYYNGIGGPVQGQQQSDDIKIWPQPNNGNFDVFVSSVISKQVKIDITNSLGQLVTELSTSTNKQVPLSLQVSQGMYFMTITTDLGCKTIRIEVNSF